MICRAGGGQQRRLCDWALFLPNGRARLRNTVWRLTSPGENSGLRGGVLCSLYMHIPLPAASTEGAPRRYLVCVCVAASTTRTHSTSPLSVQHWRGWNSGPHAAALDKGVPSKQGAQVRPFREQARKFVDYVPVASISISGSCALTHDRSCPRPKLHRADVPSINLHDFREAAPHQIC
jgi:hypothetical protein